MTDKLPIPNTKGIPISLQDAYGFGNDINTTDGDLDIVTAGQIGLTVSDSNLNSRLEINDSKSIITLKETSPAEVLNILDENDIKQISMTSDGKINTKGLTVTSTLEVDPVTTIVTKFPLGLFPTTFFDNDGTSDLILSKNDFLNSPGMGIANSTNTNTVTVVLPQANSFPVDGSIHYSYMGNEFFGNDKIVIIKTFAGDTFNDTSVTQIQIIIPGKFAIVGISGGDGAFITPFVVKLNEIPVGAKMTLPLGSLVALNVTFTKIAFTVVTLEDNSQITDVDLANNDVVVGLKGRYNLSYTAQVNAALVGGNYQFQCKLVLTRSAVESDIDGSLVEVGNFNGEGTSVSINIPLLTFEAGDTIHMEALSDDAGARLNGASISTQTEF